MSSYETIILERRGEIAVLTLNRPKAANTLSRQLMEELIAATDELRADESVRAVIITGAGERHFCGGADLRDAGDSARGGKIVVPPRMAIDEIERLPQPVIAAINGAAMGGGCEIALCCDFRLIADDAKIGLTEISFGALPGGGGTQRLPRLIGVGKAKELIMFGKRLTADEALEIGLVHEVVPKAQLLQRAEAMATELCDLAPYALQGAKRCINEGLSMTLEQGLRLERQIILTMGSPEERQEAIDRAMQKSDTYKNIFAGAKS
jgi:enoyl-CoA hydratase